VKAFHPSIVCGATRCGFTGPSSSLIFLAANAAPASNATNFPKAHWNNWFPKPLWWMATTIFFALLSAGGGLQVAASKAHAASIAPRWASRFDEAGPR